MLLLRDGRQKQAARKHLRTSIFEGDFIECWCGQTGEINTGCDGSAWCDWNDVVMTEKDHFDKYYREKYPDFWIRVGKSNNQACTHYFDCLNTWQIARAQAIPEGFVLVPREPTNHQIEYCQTMKFREGVGRSHKFEDIFVYKAMIEAQEQSHG